jgi:arylsulfatase A-like enzyme
LCEIAGVPLPDDRTIDGRSFLPVLSGGAVVRDRAYYWHHPHHHFAIRDGDWKLLATAEYQSVELYDIRADPSERNNRLATEKERAADLLEKLKSLRTEIESEGPRWKAWPKRGPLKAEGYRSGVENC